ncbi:hypothetical protein YPPY10_1007, partial [Yersinia pestis PY-10]
MAGLRI